MCGGFIVVLGFFNEYVQVWVRRWMTNLWQAAWTSSVHSSQKIREGTGRTAADKAEFRKDSIKWVGDIRKKAESRAKHWVGEGNGSDT